MVECGPLATEFKITFSYSWSFPTIEGQAIVLYPVAGVFPNYGLHIF